MTRLLARIGWALSLSVAFSLLVIPVANAYLDPGTGSMVFQAVIAGAMAAALSLKLFWRRITAMFRREEVPPAGEPDPPGHRDRG
jgi:hypothetical protein